MQHPRCAPQGVAAVWACCLPAKCTGYELCHHFRLVAIILLFRGGCRSIFLYILCTVSEYFYEKLKIIFIIIYKMAD